MKIFKKFALLLQLFVLANTNYSQSSSNFSQFFLQDYSYNSSLIGTNDNLHDVSVIHRKWSADFFGTSPNTTNVGIDKSFEKYPRWGFAFQYVNDNQGQAFSSNNFRGGLSFSPNPKGSLPISFGLGLNYLRTQFNPSDFENMEPGDQLLNAGQLINHFLTPSFGLNIKFSKESFLLQLGFASTNLQDFLNTQSKNLSETLFDQYNGFLKMRIGEEDDFNFNLISLYRANGGLSTDKYGGWSNNLLPRSLNIVGLFNFENNISFGPSLNTYFIGDNSISFPSAGGIISFPISKDKKFNLGIAYDFSLGNLQQYSKGTFEISLSGSFGDGKNYSKNEDKEEVEEKPKKKTKKLGVSDIFIKTGDKKIDVKNISIVDGSHKSFFKMSGSSWDHAIEGFRFKLKFLKKPPSSISFDLIKVKISGNELIEVETLLNNQVFLIDRFDQTGENNWIEIKLESDREKQRYLLRIYDSKKPESKVEFKFFKDWR